jgi:hypothetical protein
LVVVVGYIPMLLCEYVVFDTSKGLIRIYISFLNFLLTINYGKHEKKGKI